MIDNHIIKKYVMIKKRVDNIQLLLNGDVITIPEDDTIYISAKDIEIIGTRPYYEVKNGSYLIKEIRNGNNIK